MARQVAPSINPFPGPRPYTVADKDHFHGREQATIEVCEQVLSRRVLTLFGPSGAGKSSLLQAGVLPTLERDWRMRVVVVDAWPPDTIAKVGPLGQLCLELALDLGLGADALGEEPDRALARVLKLAFRRSRRKIVIVLDQLEQLLVRHPREVLDQFVATLRDLEARRDLGLHVVLSLREDFLGRWNELLHDNPRLLRHTYRLGRLTVDEATKASIRSAAEGRPSQIWSPAALRPLIEEMAVEGQWASDRAEVESAYVQIVCRALFDRGRGPGGGSRNARQILVDYLNDTLHALGPLEAAGWDLLETRLITRDGSRTPISRAVAVDEVGSEEDAQTILDALEHARVLRAVRLRGETIFELGHDWLATPIRRRAEQRRAAEAAAEAARLKAEEDAKAAAERAEMERKASRARVARGLIALTVVVVGAVGWGLMVRATVAEADAVNAQKAAVNAKEVAETVKAKAVELAVGDVVEERGDPRRILAVMRLQKEVAPDSRNPAVAGVAWELLDVVPTLREQRVIPLDDAAPSAAPQPLSQTLEWSLPAGQATARFAGGTDLVLVANGGETSLSVVEAPISAAAVSQDGQMLVVGSMSGELRAIFLTPAGRPGATLSLDGHDRAIASIEITAGASGGSSDTITSMDRDGERRTWADAWRLIRMFPFSDRVELVVDVEPTWTEVEPPLNASFPVQYFELPCTHPDAGSHPETNQPIVAAAVFMGGRFLVSNLVKATGSTRLPGPVAPIARVACADDSRKLVIQNTGGVYMSWDLDEIADPVPLLLELSDGLTMPELDCEEFAFLEPSEELCPSRRATTP